MTYTFDFGDFKLNYKYTKHLKPELSYRRGIMMFTTKEPFMEIKLPYNDKTFEGIQRTLMKIKLDNE